MFLYFDARSTEVEISLGLYLDERPTEIEISVVLLPFSFVPPLLRLSELLGSRCLSFS